MEWGNRARLSTRKCLVPRFSTSQLGYISVGLTSVRSGYTHCAPLWLAWRRRWNMIPEKYNFQTYISHFLVAACLCLNTNRHKLGRLTLRCQEIILANENNMSGLSKGAENSMFTLKSSGVQFFASSYFPIFILLHHCVQ